jgi:hypothetical protein
MAGGFIGKSLERTAFLSSLYHSGGALSVGIESAVNEVYKNEAGRSC